MTRGIINMSNNFGNNIKGLLKEKNLSVRAFAKKINKPQKTVQEWINGDNNRIPRDPNDLKTIANYFGCSVHFLLFGEEDPKSLLGEILEKTTVHSGLYQIEIKKVKTK